jgi:hypothetical protein
MLSMTSFRHITRATFSIVLASCSPGLLESSMHLKVVQDEDSGIVLQSTLEGHVIQIDLQVINRIIGVLVL